MKIVEKIRAKKASLRISSEDARLEARENRDLAVAAIHGGVRSKAWETYMRQFADNKDQLMRLIATDNTLENDDLKIKRAYVVGNAVCGSGTPTELDRNVETIDEGVREDVERF